MAARRFAWVLNLDADLELAVGLGYTPRRRVREAMKPFVASLARSLLGPEDVLIDETSPPLAGRGLAGRAFCPTPCALTMLRRAVAVPEAAPTFEVLRRVNSRAFSASLGVTLEGAAFVTNLDDARAKLTEAPALGTGWRIKRAFGMSGRGQRVVEAGRLTDADLAFTRAAMADGGVQIEPNVVVVREYAIHGMLGESGSLRLGSLVSQRCDARGAWLATETVMPPSAAEYEIAWSLREEAQRTAGALGEARYFGPFGIDAYTYLGRDNAINLQLRSEINARYSMGFAVGFTQ